MARFRGTTLAARPGSRGGPRMDPPSPDGRRRRGSSRRSGGTPDPMSVSEIERGRRARNGRRAEVLDTAARLWIPERGRARRGPRWRRRAPPRAPRARRDREAGGDATAVALAVAVAPAVA